MQITSKTAWKKNQEGYLIQYEKKNLRWFVDNRCYPSRQKFEKTRLNTQNYTFSSVFRRPKKTERLNAYSSRSSSMNTINFSLHTFHRRLYASKVSFLIV